MSECEAEGPWGRCEEYKGHDRWPDREREHVVWERGVNWSTEHRWWGPLDLNEPQLIGLEYIENKFRDKDQPPPVPPLRSVPHLSNIYPGWPTPWQLWERLMSRRRGGRS